MKSKEHKVGRVRDILERKIFELFFQNEWGFSDGDERKSTEAKERILKDESI